MTKIVSTAPEARHRFHQIVCRHFPGVMRDHDGELELIGEIGEIGEGGVIRFV